MKVVKNFALDIETAALLERLSKEMEKPQSQIVRELILEMAEREGLKIKSGGG